MGSVGEDGIACCPNKIMVCMHTSEYHTAPHKYKPECQFKRNRNINRNAVLGPLASFAFRKQLTPQLIPWPRKPSPMTFPQATCSLFGPLGTSLLLWFLEPLCVFLRSVWLTMTFSNVIKCHYKDTLSDFSAKNSFLSACPSVPSPFTPLLLPTPSLLDVLFDPWLLDLFLQCYCYLFIY